jgi:NADPH:quinone reductase-like Zn-dependent oxidoreductase
MKAIVQHRYGAPHDVLDLAEVEMPVAGAEDVLVSVRASSASPWDWHFIRGEPLLVRPAGLGGRPQTEVPGPGRGPRRNGAAGRQRRHGIQAGR